MDYQEQRRKEDRAALRTWAGIGLAVAAAFGINYAVDQTTVVMDGEYHLQSSLDEQVQATYVLEGKEGAISYPRDVVVEMYKKSADLADLNIPTSKLVSKNQISPIAKKIWQASEGPLDYVKRVLQFINDNVEYEPDTHAYHNPFTGWFYDWQASGAEDTPSGREREADFTKRPFQTLLDKKGDCDDYAALFSSFMAYAPIETGIAHSPGHAASAIAIYGKDWEEIAVDILDTLTEDSPVAVGTFHVGSASTLTVNKKTTTTELETLIGEEVPQVFGARTKMYLHSPETKTGKRNETCRDKWLGDLIVTIQDRRDKPFGVHRRALGESHTFGNILYDARKILEGEDHVTRRDHVVYTLPNLSDSFIMVTPQLQPASLDCDEGDDLPELWITHDGSRSAGFARGKKSEDLDQYKVRRVFYVEPQSTGFKLHDRLPGAVRVNWLEDNQYQRLEETKE